MIKKQLTYFGFTLIELMVVISIIAVLSGISIFALNDARVSGRDAKRKADLSHIASGLELYKADCNFYPNATSLPGPGNALTGVAPCAVAYSGNRYIEAMPDDPDTSLNYIYVPTTSSGGGCAGNCTRFRLWTRLENAPTTLPSYCTSAPSCGTSGACNFCIVNP